MRMSFSIYSRRPLGRLFPEFLQVIEKSSLISLEAMSLFSRAGRTDLPKEDIVQTARQSSSDVCRLQLERGTVELMWQYGQHCGAQDITGTLRVDRNELTIFRTLMTDLCAWAEAVYGYADQRKVIDEDVSLVGGDLFPKNAFVGLYWYNYFGQEYRTLLNTDHASWPEDLELEPRTDGSLIVVLGAPGRKAPCVEELAARWPVFKKYDSRARFPRSIEIDYSLVRNLPAPQSKLGTIGSVVGPADEFIESVETHSTRFLLWARSKGVEARTEQDVLRLLRDHAQVIEDEEGLLTGAIAAYGEIVREKIGGVWRKTLIFYRGEPVVAKQGQPWTSRRVVLEVLRGLEKSPK